MAEFNTPTCYFRWSDLYRSYVLRHIRLQSFVINVCTLFHHSRFLFHLRISLYGWDVFPILLFCAVKNSCETYAWDHIFRLDGFENSFVALMIIYHGSDFVSEA